MPKIRLLLVFSRELFREGLALLLNSTGEIDVVATCSNELKCVEKALVLKPDVVLCDAELQGGNSVELIKHMIQELPDTKIMMFTLPPESPDLLAAIEAGAMGYVNKDISVSALLKAISLVHAGEVVIGAPIAKRLFQEFGSVKSNGQTELKETAVISERESEVLRMVADGATNKEIASKLFLSEHTVKVHLRNIMGKLHVRNRQQAAAWAIKGGMKPKIGSVSDN